MKPWNPPIPAIFATLLLATLLTAVSRLTLKDPILAGGDVVIVLESIAEY